MKVVKFDRSQDIPIIEAMLQGPRQGGRARLVFDTGSGLTQIDTALMEELGYSATGRKYGVSDNAIRKWLKNYKSYEYIS